MYHHRETILSNQRTMMKQGMGLRLTDIGRPKENFKLIYGGPSLGQASGTNQRIKALRQSRHRV